MRVWLPTVSGGSGTDSFTRNLARGLEDSGHEVVLQSFPRLTQVVPDFLRFTPAPEQCDVTLTNAANGFAFVRQAIPMVTVVHHWVHEPAYAPFRTRQQALYHRFVLGPYERRSLTNAEEVVAVSKATARAVSNDIGGLNSTVIRNGVDTTFFTPGPSNFGERSGPFQLLFVGNLTRRKGADLLAPTMRILGSDFVLEYTSGLRSHGEVAAENAVSLGRLSREALRDAYQRADALFLPSRLEGGPLVAFEAMACGLPVVASNVSAMPETIKDRSTGLLCEIDPTAFAEAFRTLAADSNLRWRLARNARLEAVRSLGIDSMTQSYTDLMEKHIAA